MTLAVNIAQGGSNNVTMRNRIINGAMVIDQRNSGASVTLANDTATYTLDRWYAQENTAAVIAIQQSTTVPTGFKNSLLWTVSSTGSVSAGSYNIIVQPIEGFNVADLGFGASGASTITISFWVRCSVAATYGGAIRNSAQNRSYSFAFTINSANTWEQKTVTIAGDTSGTWLTNNGVGLDLVISLGSGSNFQSTANVWYAGNQHCPTGSASLVGTASATFYITGVQLEAGTTASPFEYRQYGTELALCQRYFQKLADGSSVSTCSLATVVSSDTSSIFGLIPFQVPMRTAPSLATTATSFRANMGSVNANSTTALVTDIVSNINIRISQAGYGGALTTDRSGVVRLNSDTGYVAVTAEL